MSSAKKTEKSRKAKATIARAAMKSRTATKAKKPSESKARQTRTAPARAPAKPAARTAAKAKAKTAASPATTRSKSAAAKLRTAQARLKTQAAAAKATRPAAKAPTAKAAPAKSAAPKHKTKTTQSSAAAKLKRSTTASRGKSRPGRAAPIEAKLARVAVAIQQPAAPQTELPAVKKADHERRAQVAAVLALRSLQKPTPAARPAARTDEANKASVTQKAPKKAAEAAPAPVRAAAPAAPKVAVPPAPEAKPHPVAEAKPAPVVEKPKPAKPAAPVKHGFKPLEFVVYPSHGVGQILAVEEQEVAGFKLELFVISFSKDKMILKVPTPKSIAVGMRKLASAEVVKHALNTLTGRARIKRTMWSRRAQEYEAKINSGDLVAIAEVVRDLYRSEAQPEQSYSERQLYEAALDRVAREFAAVQKLTETEALKLIDTQLQKSPRRGKAEESESEGDSEVEVAVENDGGIDEAA